MKGLVTGLVLVFAVAAAANAQTMFERGEQLFLENKPAEAARYLEASLQQDPANAKAYLYLGIVYEQLRNNDKAIGILKRGVDVATGFKDLLYFNMGNNYYTKGDFPNAVAMYGQALAANGSLSAAYLNRANASVKLGRNEEAVEDYSFYLTIEPATPQKSQIERMIQLLTRMAQEEQVRKIDEERRKQEEAARLQAQEERQRLEEEQRKLAEEQRRREEEAKQKALLESILNSLQNSTVNTRNLSAEKEQIRDVKTETDIED